MEYIKINEREDILKFGFLGVDDKPLTNNKGEEYYWTFDLGDIELPLKWNMVEYNYKKNVDWLRNQNVIIDKQEETKSKGSLSNKNLKKIEVLQEYYKKQMANYNLVLGENGVETFLEAYNVKPYWEMFDDIDKAMEQVLPKFENVFENINKKIKDKYKDKEDNVLK